MSCACNKRIKEKNAKLAKMNYKSCSVAASAVAASEERRLSTPKYTTAASDSGTVVTQLNWNPGPSFCIRTWHCNVGERVKMKETFYDDSDIEVKVVVGDRIELDRVERHENGAESSERYLSMAAMIQAKGGLGRRDVDEAWPSKYDDEASSLKTNASEVVPVAGPSGINASEAAPVAGSSGIKASEVASLAGSSGINASGAASVEVTGTGLVNGRPVINRLFIEQLFNSSDDSDDDMWDPDEGFHERCIDGKNIKILSMNVL
jgi:hypothetical protein